ncbi:hypothetical protein [Haloferula sp.]|uniref:hypothetical protein n=1 Tax=Haloferula sp. TaxID=2497595 RepID=UPI00329AF914
MRFLVQPVFGFCVLFSSCSSYRQQAEIIDDLANGQGTPVQEESDAHPYERYGIPQDEPGDEVSSQSGQSQSQPGSATYPAARKTDNPNIVESPYSPNHKVNVRGFSSGQLARDPQNGKIFRIP